MKDDLVRHVLVTGAASGIGLEVARGYAADGCRLTLVDFDARRLAEAEESCRSLGGDAQSLVADLRDTEAPAQVMDAAFAAGPLDVLVNAAGVYPAVPLLDVTAEIWDAVQAINVRAPLLLTVELARRTAGRTSDPPTGCPSVVNISSGAALRARPGAAPYTTSKAAVEMATRAAALELGPLGIRVNAVAPGFIAVDSTLNPLSDEYVSKISENPLGRVGVPADIARAVRWIASPAAEWITGEVLRVDGGANAGTLGLPIHWSEPRLDVHTDDQEGRADA